MTKDSKDVYILIMSILSPSNLSTRKTNSIYSWTSKTVRLKPDSTSPVLSKKIDGHFYGEPIHISLHNSTTCWEDAAS